MICDWVALFQKQSRDDTVVRAIPSHQSGLFLPRSESFSLGSPVFRHPQKQKCKFRFHHDRVTAWKPVKADVAYSLNIQIHLFIYLIFISYRCC